MTGERDDLIQTQLHLQKQTVKLHFSHAFSWRSMPYKRQKLNFVVSGAASTFGWLIDWLVGWLIDLQKFDIWASQTTAAETRLAIVITTLQLAYAFIQNDSVRH